jgi:hypothetical protein
MPQEPRSAERTYGMSARPATKSDSLSEEDGSVFAPLEGTLSRCSKDDHFRSLALVRGAPPKVVWLQVGNASTSHVADVLRVNAQHLMTFSLNPFEALFSLRRLVRIDLPDRSAKSLL